MWNIIINGGMENITGHVNRAGLKPGAGREGVGFLSPGFARGYPHAAPPGLRTK
jgi:hypothetical protein